MYLFKLPTEMMKELFELREKNHTPMAKMVREAVQRYIKSEKRKYLTVQKRG